MGSHRKPRPGIWETPAARRGAMSVGAAALASATLLTHTAHADDDDTPGIEEQRERAEQAAQRATEVKDRVDELYHEAGVATQHYNEATEDAEEQQELVDALLEDAAEATAEVNEARRTLGDFAAAQYRNGSAGLTGTATLLLATDPQSFFDRTRTLDRMGDQQQRALDDYLQDREAAAEQRDEATEALGELQEREEELQEQKETVQGKLAEARELLDELTAEEEAQLEELERLEREEAERRREERERRERERARQQAQQEQDAQEAQDTQEAAGDAPESGAGTGEGTGEAQTAESGGGEQAQGASATQAAAAVAFAEAQLGKPYVYGATGPGTWDCSGLTQAAWRAAGVEIPRVTWDQVEIGTAVGRADLQPGDLVFFYDDISHVGLYIGDGTMIHAPKPGDVVKIESIDYMPWHSARRPV